MKLLKTSRAAELSEHAVTLLAEEPDDMWNAYNLVLPSDTVRAETTRSVSHVTALGAATSQRVTCVLSVTVESTTWDPTISKLHVKGRISSETSVASMGQYHTLHLEVGRPFTIDRPDGWDSVATTMLRDALRTDKGGAVAAVVMQEGLANICLVTESRTILLQRLERKVPSKRDDPKALASSSRAFYDLVLTNLTREIDFESAPRPLLLASPGFVAADFKTYIGTKAIRGERPDKTLLAMVNNATVLHSPTGHLHSLNDILKSREVAATMRDMRFAKEAQCINQFYEMLRVEDGRAWYGSASVEKVVAEGAVGAGGVLLICDDLFRSEDTETRKKYVALVERVKAGGGDARILSAAHESGERLAMLGGVAAILTYPVYEIEEEEEEAGLAAESEVERPLEGSII
ncbi:related to DOM34 - functions in protein translation to promote G1 progression and differentiation [Cephalotrichum gorgonifer]|uniref:Protein DOM34 homolog n=1 Tax=Cephalotrichum gorgonifer TaxID=2041049 RepID=A0AAE8N0H2_9PEZI|nr:related to DOM34 - functions in protein translation to promote G1 progression and differentiation [Cephalotrichum gorgonifer]